MDERSFIITKKDKSLVLKIIFIHLDKEYPLEILLQREQDLLKTIDELKNEIESLKNKLKQEEKSKEKLEEIQKLNEKYNIKYDSTLYKLEEIYKLIIHDIIQKREELGLINYGVKKFYNKNIQKCIINYKSSSDGNSVNYKYIEQNLTYGLIAILTTDKTRFGFFYHNLNKNKVNYNNQSYNISNIYIQQNTCGNCEKEKRNLKKNIYIQKIFSTC